MLRSEFTHCCCPSRSWELTPAGAGSSLHPLPSHTAAQAKCSIAAQGGTIKSPTSRPATPRFTIGSTRMPFIRPSWPSWTPSRAGSPIRFWCPHNFQSALLHFTVLTIAAVCNLLHSVAICALLNRCFLHPAAFCDSAAVLRSTLRRCCCFSQSDDAYVCFTLNAPTNPEGHRQQSDIVRGCVAGLCQVHHQPRASHR